MVTKIAINNSAFQDKQEIGRLAVSKWKNIYNKNYHKSITNAAQEYAPLRM
ncbi:MAG: hypothetical protein M3Z01_09420 [Thermoproteota archaeon]|nr:hypothetical protein [Thermoproteota archaeon]